MNLIQNKGTCQNIHFSLGMGVYHVGLHHIRKIRQVLIIDVKNNYPVMVDVFTYFRRIKEILHFKKHYTLHTLVKMAGFWKSIINHVRFFFCVFIRKTKLKASVDWFHKSRPEETENRSLRSSDHDRITLNHTEVNLQSSESSSVFILELVECVFRLNCCMQVCGWLLFYSGWTVDFIWLLSCDIYIFQ